MISLEKFNTYPEYTWYSDLVNQVDPNNSPQIIITHRASNSISPSCKKLGIFSGSFNPITLAHSKMIEIAHQCYEFDEILLLIAKANVDKGVFGLPIEARLLTLKVHTKNHSNISIGISSHGRYIDKIAALKEIYPKYTEFNFIVGYDTLVRLFDPKYYTDIQEELNILFTQCKFIVANRKGVSIPDIIQFIDQPYLRCYKEFIEYISLPDYYANLSSSDIRNRMDAGKKISHLVPPTIAYFLD